MIIGLTGGIATGKSTVTEMLREFGAFVIDADEWARTVVQPGSEGLAAIVLAFGACILEPDGSLSRTQLGQRIFHDITARQRLNEIVHPLVRAGMRLQTEQFLRSHPESPVVWDVPLLFEGDTHMLVDKTILVYVDEVLQCQRLMARSGYTETEAKVRIAAQMPIEQKRQLADFLIDNRGTLAETREQVRRVWQVVRGRPEPDRASSSSKNE